MFPRNMLFVLATVAALGVAVWTVGPSAVAQVGDIGAVFPGTQQSLAGETLLQSGGFSGHGGGTPSPSHFVLLSPDGKRAWGYSTTKGEWKEITLDRRTEPIVSLAVTVVTDAKKAYGFSAAKGEWDAVELSGAEPTVPVVGSHVAVVPDGRRIHAFGGPAREWDTLQLPEGIEPPPPTVGSDYVEVRTETTISIFSAHTGKWGTVEFAKKG